MFALTDLLKDGYKHLSGVNEVVLSNIDAVRKLGELTRSSLGPHGLNKMVVNHLGKLFVTSDAATILKEVDVNHPAAKIVTMATHQQEQEIGDGSNLVLILSSELLSNAELLISKGLHPSEIITGYTKASEKALAILDDMVCYNLKDIRNVQEVAQAFKASIGSKLNGLEETLAPLVAQACIDVLPENPYNFNVDSVRVQKVLGGGLIDTKLIKGLVIPHDTETTIKHIKDAKMVVYVDSIEARKTETKDTVVIESAEQLMNYNKSEEQAMEALIKSVAASGANVIVSGGKFGEMALHFIERYKLMAVRVQSKFELRRLCSTTNATPLISLNAPTADQLGFAASVSVEEIGSNVVTIVRQTNEKSGIATLLVRSSTENMLDDIERAIDDGVNVFRAMTRDGRFVAGAAAAEIELAKRLQTFGSETPGLGQYAIKKFAEAFEVVPRTLAENAGLQSIEVISSLYAAHSNPEGKDKGINLNTGAIFNASEAHVYDLLLTKAWAIRYATQAATTILRVDQIIMAKPAGGPKPPAQGARDSE